MFSMAPSMAKGYYISQDEDGVLAVLEVLHGQEDDGDGELLAAQLGAAVVSQETPDLPEPPRVWGFGRSATASSPW